MSVSKNQKLMQIIHYRIRVTIMDTRQLTGQLLAFDKHLNLVLADCEESRRTKGKGNGSVVEEKRAMGLIFLRGEEIVSMTVVSPPPASREEKKKGLSGLQLGPGMGKAATRGVPLPTPQGPTSGLQGPSRAMGVGAMPPAGFAPPPGAYPPPGMGMPPPGMPPGMPPPGFPQGARPPPGFQGGAMPPPGFRPPMPPPGFQPPH